MDLGAELENALFTESNLTELCSNGLSLCKNENVFSLYLCWSLGLLTFFSVGAKYWKASATKNAKIWTVVIQLNRIEGELYLLHEDPITLPPLFQAFSTFSSWIRTFCTWTEGISKFRWPKGLIPSVYFADHFDSQPKGPSVLLQIFACLCFTMI